MIMKMSTKIVPMKMMTKIPLQKKNDEIISKATSKRKRQRSPTKTPEQSSKKELKQP